MTDVVILSSSEQFSRELRQAFSLQRPDITPLFADDPAASGAEIAACWFPESGTLNRYPQLKLIHSVAAGVDHLGAELLQSGKVICRVVDENQKQGMFEYILWAVLYFHRDLNKVLKNNQHRHWQRYPQRLASEICIGIMGLGEIGRYVGEKLAQLGYRVNGWSRSRKNLPEIRCFSGDSEREQFLNESNILINLLPLTPETQGILCAATLSQLPQSAALINCGRGGHMVAQDIIYATESGWLQGAVLDVFPHEPLPAEDPLWTTPGIIVTPHMASAASFRTIARQIGENVDRFNSGSSPQNTINPISGY
ncbi:2-hydroxyacid dehydrogenase [Tatumella citrea]|uniref:D-isomer specific 2-hydroxyacid dehydrogenase NAD-binding domain-containing protein n=1 Tax=Tatumella citrea TaxID=53336 RepID=A0A1Y0LJI5_TATCI|nr:glyoxylate/hydroxypyruvate reductase A [Tatumella citrea]ARU93979.1 hypothetical protein A7K98_09425 [Tatumella citrea]ARU98017.1 hypothetical protein A7K99_09425 [Tatumella citrea]